MKLTVSPASTIHFIVQPSDEIFTHIENYTRLFFTLAKRLYLILTIIIQSDIIVTVANEKHPLEKGKVMATLQIYTDEGLKKAVEQVAREEDRSVSYVIRQWIQDGLQNRLQGCKSPGENKQKQQAN